MKNSRYKTIGVLCTFFVIVFAVSFAYNSNYPVLVIAGEFSVGTWMSGVLLIVSASVSLIIALRKDWFLWFSVAVFFFVLALDERFMFHERLKEYIIFSFHTTTFWIYELPVIVGACIGGIVAYLLWRNLIGMNRILLLCAVVLGTASVAFDVFTASVFLEECFKLLAELIIACSLLGKIEEEG